MTEHLQAMAAHGLPLDALHYVVAHMAPIPPKILARDAAQGSAPVAPGLARPDELPVTVRAGLLESGPIVRHAPDKLGPILCQLLTGGRANGWPARLAAGV